MIANPIIRRGYPFDWTPDDKRIARVNVVSDNFPLRTYPVPMKLTAAETGGLSAGQARWEAEDADGAFVSQGFFEIVETAKQDGEQAIPQSFAQTALAAVERALLAASDSGEVSLSADGVTFSYESRLELMEYRDRLRAEVARERIGNPTGARFVRR